MSSSENKETEHLSVVHLAGAFADRDAWDAAGWCRIERALEVVGTRSGMLLIRELFYGATRFEELVRRTGLSEAVAARRLKQLTDDGLADRQPYREPGQRTRLGYCLTSRGRALFPVLVALTQWGETLHDDHHTGVEFVHDDCGATLEAAIRCTAGHNVPLENSAVQLKSGSSTR